MLAKRQHLAPLVCLLAVLTAAAFLFVAQWGYALYRHHGASQMAALDAAAAQWAFGGAYALGAAVYWLRRPWRGALQLAGALAALQAAGVRLTGALLAMSWNIMHGDVVAVSNWAGALQVATGIACVIDYVLHKRR